MRVTNAIIKRNSQFRLQQGLQGMDRAREDISTGIRIRKMSDDPANGGQVVRIGSSLRALNQFRRNIDLAAAKTQAEEGVLTQLTNLLDRGAELSISQANASATQQSRLAAKAEVDQILSYAATLGNTKIGDEYLFGGHRAGEAPFKNPAPATGTFSALELAGVPVNPSGNPTVEISDNKFITPTHNATDVFLNTDVLESLRSLSTALGNNNPADILAAGERLNAANGNVQALIGSVGARVNDLESSRLNLDTIEINLQSQRADLRDTEIDKAMVELVGRQTLYQAAMSATSRILGLSLTNYL
jgi:flagellar hook-associated protein 3 FlgL